MKIYSISGLQFVGISIFALLFWLADIIFYSENTDNFLALILIFLLPAAFVFYLIGWIKYKGATIKSIGAWFRSFPSSHSFLFSILLGLIIIPLAYFGLTKYQEYVEKMNYNPIHTITEEYLYAYIPKNYELASFHFADLDRDDFPEAVVLIKESKFYNSNPVKETEGFLSLPVKIFVLVYEPKNDRWIDTNPINVSNDTQNESTIFYTPSFIEKPLETIETTDETLLAVYNNFPSFDGPSYSVDFFRFNKRVGLGRADVANFTSYHPILKSSNKLIFSMCNPFTFSLGMDGSEYMDIKTVDLNNLLSRTWTRTLNIRCAEYFDFEEANKNLQRDEILDSFFKREGVFDMFELTKT